jgi:hypothetical protein
MPDPPCTIGWSFQTSAPNSWGIQTRNVNESLPGRHKDVNKLNVAFHLNFWRFLDVGGDWHSRITLLITNTWRGVNKRHLRHIFFDDGHVFINENMAEKTRAILVDLLSSEDSDTLEDPGVVVIRVTPPLIPVGAIAANRNHIPKYEPVYDVVRIVPHDLEYGSAPFDFYV